MKAVLVFCEGNHDVAFVARSLGAVSNAEWMGKPIKDLPYPFGPQPGAKSLIATRYNNRVFDNVYLRAAAHAAPPSFETLLHVTGVDTIYAMVRSHGDSAPQEAIELLTQFRDALNAVLTSSISEFAAAFLYDADEAGVASRTATFATDHRELLDNAGAPSHSGWVQGKHFPVGLYVFHDPVKKKGTLEDLLAPLVEAEWPDRWRDSGVYLDSHQDSQDPVATKSAEKQKARICITGQFRFPGDPMTQVLGRKGLPAKHFDGPESQAIVTFLTGVPW